MPGWQSWSGGGCSQSPGPLGETCEQYATGNERFYGTYSLHYRSCEDPRRAPGRWDGGAWKTSGCNCCTCRDDFKFVRQLLARLEGALCIDRRRVFAVGSSYGAMMALALAQADPPLPLAAVVSVSGGLLKGFHQPLLPTNSSALAVLDLHGRSDTTVPSTVASPSQRWAKSYDGWFYTPMEDILGAAAVYSGCELGAAWRAAAWPTPWSRGGQDYRSSDELVCTDVGGRHCRNGSEVVWCVGPWGHDWPWCVPRAYSRCHRRPLTL